MGRKDESSSFPPNSSKTFFYQKMKKTDINIEELARQLEIDLKNIDIKSLARSAKRKANEKARRMYPEVFT